MKATFYLAVLALIFTSCKKDPFTIPDITPQPSLQAKIYPAVTEPRDVVLGDTNAVFKVGERITIYVPYESNYDHVTSATLNIMDESGELVASFDMTYTNDMTAGAVNVPVQLQGSNFVFASIDLQEQYAGKTLSIQTQVSGDRTLSDDYMKNAFSVMY
ncbi:MAG: hypothetical protein WCF67_22085 [Chitinophagaceae bacterium]